MAGTYTAARTKPKTRAKIVAMLAAGEPIMRIEAECGHCNETINAIKNQEYEEISKRKSLIFAQTTSVAMEAWDQIGAKLIQDRGKIPLNQLVPIAGTATDKIPILSNDPQQLNVTVTHEPGPNVFQRLESLAQRLAPPQPKPVQATVIDVSLAPVSVPVPSTGTGDDSRARP